MGLAGGADQTGDVAEFDLFVQNAATATSFAAFKTGRLRAPDACATVERDARKLSVSGAKNGACRAGQVELGGLRKAFRISQRVLDRVAHVRDAQLRDDRAVDQFDHRVRDRLTRMSISSAEALKSQRASITPRPLFIIVAESTVIFAPIRHVGCRSAWAGVAFSISSFDEFRKGPPDAVRISRLLRRAVRRAGTGKALCSLSTGSNSAPDSSAAPSSVRRRRPASLCSPTRRGRVPARINRQQSPRRRPRRSLSPRRRRSRLRTALRRRRRPSAASRPAAQFVRSFSAPSSSPAETTRGRYCSTCRPTARRSTPRPGPPR